VDFKYPLKNFRDYLIDRIEKSDVELKLGTMAAPADIDGFDAVIAALGSVPFVPPIPGIETVLPALKVFGVEDTLGTDLVVIGGGQVGCETALHLARHGKRVTILEMRDKLAPDASPTSRDELVVEIKKEQNLTIICGAVCKAIEKMSVTYQKDGTTRILVTDGIILAAGMKARSVEADTFIGLTRDYVQVGDCVRPRTVEWAVKEGFYAAMNL
jgi:pyruvate/2-oxoglutarate dehydrogenase complex dihydrolipoamide dehydrogenase (E3) component